MYVEMYGCIMVTSYVGNTKGVWCGGHFDGDDITAGRKGGSYHSR